MPDAVVVEEIAAQFRLRHERFEPAPMDHSLFGQRLFADVFQTVERRERWT